MLVARERQLQQQAREGSAAPWSAPSSKDDDWLPRSSHPQERLGHSWTGHRDPGCSSAGRAHAVAFPQRSVRPSALRRLLPGSLLPPVRVDKDGHEVAEVDEAECEALRRRSQSLPAGPPPLPLAYKGENYGTNQLLMPWQEKEVGLPSRLL